MAASRLDRIHFRQLLSHRRPSILQSTPATHSYNHTSRLRPGRNFTSSTSRYEQQTHRKESFSSRLRSALGKTKITWYPIPVGLGIGFLGFAQLYKVQQREKARIAEEEEARGGGAGGGDEEPGKPKKRKKTRPSGPW